MTEGLVNIETGTSTLIDGEWVPEFYEYDPTVPEHVKGMKVGRGNRVTVRCNHPECGVLFTYTYNGGTLRGQCTYAHKRDLKNFDWELDDVGNRTGQKVRIGTTVMPVSTRPMPWGDHVWAASPRNGIG